MSEKSKKQQDRKAPALPPIVREVPDPPVPNRAHTEMKREQPQKKAGERDSHP